jgi:hypothetical protein
MRQHVEAATRTLRHRGVRLERLPASPYELGTSVRYVAAAIDWSEFPTDFARRVWYIDAVHHTPQ